MDDLPELRKGTRAAVQIATQFAPDGGVLGIVIIKELFGVDQRQRVERAGDAKVRLVDEPWEPDQPETSSTKLPSDVCARKPSTDVLIVGSAVAPGGKRVRSVDVYARVGPIEKALRVHGTRVFYQGAKGLALSPGEPFDVVPLRWELAFGGSDFSDPKHPLEEPRNPVGRGIAHQVRDLLNKPGPQIEDPRDPIGGGGRPAPAGTAALGRHWEPRRRYVGTHDEKWMRDRMPLPPLDFDERFNQVAPADQIAPAYLRGGELVQVSNMNMLGAIQFELPHLTFFVGASVDGKLTEYRAALDTVIVLPTDRQVELTWRAAIPLPKRRARMEFVQVHEKELV
jgi:hypothetical protein